MDKKKDILIDIPETNFNLTKTDNKSKSVRTCVNSLFGLFYTILAISFYYISQNVMTQEIKNIWIVYLWITFLISELIYSVWKIHKKNDKPIGPSDFILFGRYFICLMILGWLYKY